MASPAGKRSAKAGAQRPVKKHKVEHELGENAPVCIATDILQPANLDVLGTMDMYLKAIAESVTFADVGMDKPQPIAKGKGVQQDPFDMEKCKLAHESDTGKYKCAVNISWLRFQNLMPYANVSLARQYVERLKKAHFSDEPMSLPDLDLGVVAPLHGQYDLGKENGMVLISPPELVVAFF